MNDIEWLSMREAARRLGRSHTMVARYVDRGMPRRSGDGKIPWPTAKEWVSKSIVPERSGNWRFRQFVTRGQVLDFSLPGNRAFGSGAGWTWFQLRNSFVEILGPSKLPLIPRTMPIALIDILCRGWYKDCQLKSIDWSPFGRHANIAKQRYDEWIAYFTVQI